MMGRVARVAVFFVPWLSMTVSIGRAEEVPRPEHPRPDAARPHWSNLNGKWEFRFDPKDEGVQARWFAPSEKGFDRSIVVPFGWESALSGIQDTSGSVKIGWYRRRFRIPADFPLDQHIWLRFEAVDWQADVWVNGQKVARHEGGYTPFEADITAAARRDRENVVVVRAFDPTDPSLPTGKQIGWYTPTSGIWQTVWLEARPRAYIAQHFIRTASLVPGRIDLGLIPEGVRRGRYEISVRSSDPTVVPFHDEKEVTADALGAISLSIPINDPKPWTPETPHLYDLTIELKANDGAIDRLTTYFGLRTITRGQLSGDSFERVFLNGKPIYLRGALDQSFNPQGIYTAPSDDFLKQDILLAKSLGLNFLRIHIKPDEPRRLYWADRLGLLIMEDLPNTWNQNETARKAWSATMREVIQRDRNHPAIFAWVAFNETWGLSRRNARAREDYKTDKETQQWVKQMVAAIRVLDPTRLVEDNSPCYYDHVSVTDLNSWHFYIDDDQAARRHIEEVVAKSTPGSEFNHCPGELMNTAPLINSEYGAVSAGGGDRDVSWGFRDLTTQLRKHNKIQGYIYTELSDIEWEHNGFVNYDRSPKVFGYDAFVPGMTVADLQGADFVGYDTAPVIVTKPAETISVPVFVSHYSDRQERPRLRWQIRGWNELGRRIVLPPLEREAIWMPYSVTQQEPIVIKLDGPFVGALGLELLDAAGRRIAANFVNLVCRPTQPLPRVERVDDHTVRFRFSPGDFAQAKWSGPVATPQGKAHGQGTGFFEYHLRLPASVAKAGPIWARLLLEVGAKAGREKVDWPSRVNRQDYPQTDSRTWPTLLDIAVNGRRFGAPATLRDDAADARGVLSHLARVEHGSHGERFDLSNILPEPTAEELAAEKPLILRLEVPDNQPFRGGLALFGAESGAFPFDPTLTIVTKDRLPADLGVDPSKGIALDTLAERRQIVLASGDTNQATPRVWKFTTSDPGPHWMNNGFDDATWREGRVGFSAPGTPGVVRRTIWNTPEIWLRTTIDLPALGADDALSLHLFHDEDVEIFVNGQRIHSEQGYLTAYRDIALDGARDVFKPGPNTIAVHCRQTTGGQGIDVGLILTRGGRN